MSTDATGKDTDRPGTGTGGTQPPESVVGGPVTDGRGPGETVVGGEPTGGPGIPGAAGAAADPTSPAGARAAVEPGLAGSTPPGVPPLAPDRPVVDGTETTAAALRAEVDQLAVEEQRRVEELREEVGDTVGELAARFDVPGRARAKKEETVANLQARKDEAVATVQQQVGRARTAVSDTVTEKPWTKPAAVAAALGVLVLLVLRRRRR